MAKLKNTVRGDLFLCGMKKGKWICKCTKCNNYYKISERDINKNIGILCSDHTNPADSNNLWKYEASFNGIAIDENKKGFQIYDLEEKSVKNIIKELVDNMGIKDKNAFLSELIYQHIKHLI